MRACRVVLGLAFCLTACRDAGAPARDDDEDDGADVVSDDDEGPADEQADDDGEPGGRGGSVAAGGGGGSAGSGGTGGAPPSPDAGGSADAAVVVAPDAGSRDTGGADVQVIALANEAVVWNGDGIGDGRETHWMGRGQEGKTTLTYSTDESRSPTHAMAFSMKEMTYAEFGWGFKATPTTYKYLSLWMNVVRLPAKGGANDGFITLKGQGGGYAAPGGGRGVKVSAYNRTALRGGWQQLVIPVKDIIGSQGGFAQVTEILVGLVGCPTCSFTLYVDDISFGN